MKRIKKQAVQSLNVWSPENMTKDERSIMCYLESCSVDQGGMVEGIRMNSDDHEAIERLKACGFVEFGRIPAKLLGASPGGKKYTHWTRLTETGWNLAWKCRRYRAFDVVSKLHPGSMPYATEVWAEVEARAA